MSDMIATGKTVTFTISSMPKREASRKTIHRLMQLQPAVRSGLKKLQHRRKRIDNRTYVRAGKDWTDRVKATRLTRVVLGESFTLTLTPHILPDVRSIEKYVDMAAG